MNKTWYKVVAAIVTPLFLFTACSTDAEPEPEAKVSATPMTQDEQFLAAFHEEFPELGTYGDENAIDLAHSACEALDAGIPVEDVARVLINTTEDPKIQEALAFSVGAGVAIYCPRHNDLIQNSSGS